MQDVTHWACGNIAQLLRRGRPPPAGQPSMQRGHKGPFNPSWKKGKIVIFCAPFSNLPLNPIFPTGSQQGLPGEAAGEEPRC